MGEFLNEILGSIQAIYDFVMTGSYTFVQEIFAEIMIWAATWWIKIKIASIVFFWGVAEAMLDQLGISQFIDTAWGRLDSQTLNFFTRYNIPEAINLGISAKLTAFILRII